MIKYMIKSIYFFFYNYMNHTKIESGFVAKSAQISKGVNIGILSSVDGVSEIGKYSSIGKNVNITKTKIGNYVSIANNVSIGQGEHDLNRISLKAMFYKDGYDTLVPGECIIENDVWIGANAIILRGVHIGNGAVIGAGAVVTKDVDNFEVVVGVPAKKIKERFSKDFQKRILKTEWWQKEPDEADKIFFQIEKDRSAEFKN